MDFFFFNFQRLYLLVSEVSSVFLYYFLKIEIQFRTGYLPKGAGSISTVFYLKMEMCVKKKRPEFCKANRKQIIMENNEK